MENFWDYSVWGTFSLFAVLFLSLLVGNMLKKGVPFLKNSLIPTSVIGGLILIIVAAIYKSFTDVSMFDTAFFGGDGTAKLEIITYHALALGFIASTLKKTGKKMSQKRTEEIFNTGVTTVATYLLQGFIGLAITIVAAFVLPDFFAAAGTLLPFGYGQGTGQAMNYGNIYEKEWGFDGGKSFGLTIAALGFISAALGGVVHLNIMKHKGKIKVKKNVNENAGEDVLASDNEIPLSESMDKMTVQITLIAVVYFMTYTIMTLLGNLLPGLKSVIYGFNFLLGVLCAILMKGIINLLKRMDIVKRDYTNNFLLTRASNFCFDIMIVSGIAAIRLDIIERFWGILIILGVVGLFITYVYNRFIAKALFGDYVEEQFLAMYGMLTGTASTGVILLREADPEFKTPAADNLVYQNLPAIVFGFPMMFLATLSPKYPVLTMIIFAVLFVVMNIILFRRQLFFRKHGKAVSEDTAKEE